MYVLRILNVFSPLGEYTKSPSVMWTREGGDTTQYPKFYNLIFLFDGSKALGTFIKFWLVGSKLFNQISFIVQKWYLILLSAIGVVSQFFVPCLIPE